MTSQPVRITIFNATEDREEAEMLVQFFTPVIRANKVRVKIFTDFEGAGKRQDAAQERLQETDIAILLVSGKGLAAFEPSDTEGSGDDPLLAVAYAQLETMRIVVIPVLLEPCFWEAARLIEETQMLPPVGPKNTQIKALSLWSNRLKGYEAIVQGVMRAVEKLTAP